LVRALNGSVANDPTATLAVHCGNGFDAGFSPTKVLVYLQCKFGDNLAPARAAMGHLARSMPPKTLAVSGYALYVKFRPGVPTGVKGWGARGKLDLNLIRRLTKASRSRH
jgi:hypothetical protein